MPPNRRFPFQGPRPASSAAPMPNKMSQIPKSAPVPIPAPPSQPSKNRSSAAEQNPLQALLHKLDGDTLLILAVLLLLYKEQTDRRLLLALAYIIL